MVFHDLTGQVVAKVVTLASDLESSLVALLVSVVPPEQREKACGSALHDPLIDPAGRARVVGSRGEVDELLASLGFRRSRSSLAAGVLQPGHAIEDRAARRVVDAVADEVAMALELHMAVRVQRMQ